MTGARPSHNENENGNVEEDAPMDDRSDHNGDDGDGRGDGDSDNGRGGGDSDNRRGDGDDDNRRGDRNGGGDG